MSPAVSTSTLSMPRGAQVVRYLYPQGPPWAKAIPTTAGESVILHGDPGSGLEEASDWVTQASPLAERPVISLSLALVGDYQTLVHKLLLAMAVAAFGEDAAAGLIALQRGDPGEMPDLALSGRGEFLRLATALADADAGYATGAVAEVLRLGREGLLLVRDAHLLTQRWSREVLWEIRGVVQEERRHALLLTCPTEARNSLGGQRAPFFGAGAIAEVGAERDERTWAQVMRAHDLNVSVEDLEFVLGRTWGLAVPTLEVLIDAQSVGANAALAKHARAAVDQVPLVMRLARTVNRYGPELLLRLSRGLPPYAIPSASARDVSRALRQLGFHELVARVGRRGWRVADPFISDALLSKPLEAW